MRVERKRERGKRERGGGQRAKRKREGKGESVKQTGAGGVERERLTED